MISFDTPWLIVAAPVVALLIDTVREPLNVPPAGESTGAAAAPLEGDPGAPAPTVSVAPVNPGPPAAT